jgi:4-amino-4-deoxy-L-arabinose transferase-like glycosyltransferase
VRTGTATVAAARAWAGPTVVGAIAVAAAIAIAAATTPAAVGPDASMYAAIATSIVHGHGLAYPDAAPVTARPPLYALATAVLSLVSGVVPAAVAISKLGFVGVLVCAATIATRIRGPFAGLLVVVVLGLTPLMVRWSGATLLDGVAAAFALAAIAAWSSPSLDRRTWIVAGALLGLSFLVKETAIYLLLVPIGLALIAEAPPLRRLDAAGWALAAFGAVAAPWFVWFAFQTGRTYLVDASALVGAVAVVVAVGAWVGARRLIAPARPAEATNDRTRGGTVVAWVALVALSVLWVIGGWLALEASAAQPVADDAMRSVYRYSRLTLSPDLPLFLAMAVAVPIGLAMAVRRPALRAIAIATLATAPILLFVAIRGFEARSIAVAIAGAAVLAAVVVAEACAVAARRWPRAGVPVRAAVSVALVALSIGPTAAALQRQPAVVEATTWDRPDVAQVATWLRDRVPGGGAIVSSWEYAAMLYVQADAAFRVDQVPLVRASATGDPAAPLTTLTTLGTWQDERLPAEPVGTVVYVARGVVGDWVTLERSALQQALAESGTAWLVVVGSGPAQRSGRNYPFVGQAIGSPDAALELDGDAADGGGWIRVFGVPAGVTYDSGIVSVDAAAAHLLTNGPPDVGRRAFEALGATEIHVWPPRIPAADLEQLKATGLPVVLSSD